LMRANAFYPSLSSGTDEGASKLHKQFAQAVSIYLNSSSNR